MKRISKLASLLVLGLAMGGCDRPAAPATGTGTGTTAPGSTVPATPGEPPTVQPVVTKSGIEMVHLPGGAFSMGSDHGRPDEAPAHQVVLTAFLIDKFEVTHEMYAKAQLPDPSHWKDNPRGPVERVRWRDAKQYCNERSLLEGLKPCYNEKTADWDCDFSANGYRLPTEAEWEYASRAGEADASAALPAEKLRQWAWSDANSEQKTHTVGQKKPNRWGIHDLLGNVSEWCEDVYSPTYYGQSPPADPTGPPSTGADVRRVIRGGSWKSSGEDCRPAARQGERTGDSDACFSTDYCGFRCVRRASAGEVAQMKKAGN